MPSKHHCRTYTQPVCAPVALAILVSGILQQPKTAGLQGLSVNGFLCRRDLRTHIKMQTDSFSSNGNSWNSTVPWMWMVCVKVLCPPHQQQQCWLNLLLALLPLSHRISQVCSSHCLLLQHMHPDGISSSA